jgi:hypothetical protein
MSVYRLVLFDNRVDCKQKLTDMYIPAENQRMFRQNTKF